MSHVAGKVAVITGAAGGFGLLISQLLTERGATVVGLDVKSVMAAGPST